MRRIEPVVEVRGLRKSYGGVSVVDGVSFTVGRGVVYGIVGPNGAGKTTTVECVEGLRTPDSGSVEVMGMDPERERSAMYRVVGVQFQDNSMYNRISVGEAFRLFKRLYDHPFPEDDLLEKFGLTAKRKTYYGKLSGGQKRKFLTALALIGNPELVILDEPTSGLDPQSSHRFWEALREFNRKGLSILLTTHDMQEAEEHCEVVCVFDKGKIRAEGSPGELLRERGLEKCVKVRSDKPLEVFKPLLEVEKVSSIEQNDGEVLIFGGGPDFQKKIFGFLGKNGIQGDTETRDARLEDLYMLIAGGKYEPHG